MRVAFHFDAEHFGGVYGFRITELLFRELIRCVPREQCNLFVRRGDLFAWEFARDTDDMIALAGRVVRCARPIWSSLTERALAELMERRVWVLAVEGLAPADAVAVDSRLHQIVGYLGATEIYLANPVHWVLYDRKLVAAYRLFSDELRLVATSEPEARHEAMINEWSRTGLFARVEWEDSDLRDTVFDDLSSFERAKHVAEIEDGLDSTLGPLVGIVLMRIAVLNPVLSDALHAALHALDRAESEEQLAQASLSCRRFIGQLADALYPAPRTSGKGRKVGPQEYRNRLWAYIEENVGGEERSRVHGTLQDLGRRLEALDERAQKHIHGSGISGADVRRLILAMVVWTHDVLTLTPPPERASPVPHQPAIDEFVRALVARHRKNVH